MVLLSYELASWTRAVDTSACLQTEEEVSALMQL
jgi:hypothetical protein